MDYALLKILLTIVNKGYSLLQYFIAFPWLYITCSTGNRQGLEARGSLATLPKPRCQS